MSFNAKVGATFVAWIALLASVGSFMFLHSQDEIAATDKPHHADVREQGSLGNERHATLLEATRQYVEAHPDAPAEMAEGKAFAPAEFLNEELARAHAKWRVREVHGLEAETYNVS